MTIKRFANSAETTLFSAVGGAPTDLTIVVADAGSFPSAGDFFVRVDDELMLVTAVSTNTWTVQRGKEMTDPAPHSAGAAVVQVLTAGVMDTLAVLTADQTANTVMAGPGSGGTAAPGFRALVPADLPGAVTGAVVPAGAVLAFGRLSAPAGWLGCDGSAVSRSTYADLFAALCVSQSGTRTSGSAAITGLGSTAGFQAGMPVSGTGIPGGATILSVNSGTQITLSANATSSGTAAVVVAPWGVGDGSTTFNVPDFRRRTAVGSGGSGTATLGNAVGNTGGAETHTLVTGEMPAHTHTETSYASGYLVAGGAFPAPSNTVTTPNTGSTGGDGAHNNVQPSAVVLVCVKT